MESEHQDERGTEPPAEGGREETPQEKRGEEAGQDSVSSPGPLGNPESDEEALSHRQQEQNPPDEAPAADE
jgi:hypothetical protein